MYTVRLVRIASCTTVPEVPPNWTRERAVGQKRTYPWRLVVAALPPLMNRLACATDAELPVVLVLLTPSIVSLFLRLVVFRIDFLVGRRVENLRLPHRRVFAVECERRPERFVVFFALDDVDLRFHAIFVFVGW